jgi:GntR family transcriptional regulator
MAAKYDRIADDLRRRIQAGEFAPGAQLPTESVLMELYRVSLPTIRSALSVLRGEGLVESRHGLGTYIRQPRQRVRRHNVRYQWEKDRVLAPEAERRAIGSTERDTGLGVDDLDFTNEYDTHARAEARIAALLGIKSGSRVLMRTFTARSRKEDVPLSYAHSYLPYDLVKANPALLDVHNEPWPGGTQHQLSTLGIELDHITDEIIARPPTATEAEQLDMPAGTSLLIVRKTSVATDGRVVEVMEIFMPGDRHELVYTTKLDPWQQ